jgi:hypothetical protein
MRKGLTGGRALKAQRNGTCEASRASKLGCRKRNEKAAETGLPGRHETLLHGNTEDDPKAF